MPTFLWDPSPRATEIPPCFIQPSLRAPNPTNENTEVDESDEQVSQLHLWVIRVLLHQTVADSSALFHSAIPLPAQLQKSRSSFQFLTAMPWHHKKDLLAQPLPYKHSIHHHLLFDFILSQDWK